MNSTNTVPDAPSNNDKDDNTSTPRSGERKWIEAEWLTSQSAAADDDDPEETAIPDMFDLFADPDPWTTFRFDFASPQHPTPLSVELVGYKAELGQTLHSTGLTLWRASSILCHYTMERADRLLRQPTAVLELGAGLGLCGILVSLLGVTDVTMTDGDTDALARMRDNVAANFPEDNNRETAAQPHCRQLVWGEDLDQFAQEREGGWDVILGSDIIYVEEILTPLWNTVDKLLASDGEFWLAYARRNVSIDLVLDEAKQRNFTWSTPASAEGVFVFRRRT